MKNSMLAVLAVLALAACGSSPSALCKDSIKTTCNKTFTCYTGAELDAIKSFFGATEAECVTKLTASAECDRSDFDSKPCETGKTYDSAKASTCTSEFKALECSALKAGTTPESCKAVCK